MIPYVLLIFVPIMFNYVMVIKHDDGLNFGIGKSQYVKANSLALPVFFLIFILLLMFRDETIGRDLRMYKILFNSYIDDEFRTLMTFRLEFLFPVLCWIIGQVSSSYQLFLSVVALITVLPIASVYCDDRRHSYLKIIMFVNMVTFPMIFSGLRQAIAMAIGMLSYHFVRQKKLVLFLITVLVALGFHHSAFILFFMYPLYHFSFRRRHLLFLIPIMVVVFVNNQQIFKHLMNILSMYFEDYANVPLTFSNAYGSLVLFVLYTIFAYFIPDEKQMDHEIIGLRNYMILIVCIQCFAPLHPLAMRFNYYFMMFIPLLISKIIDIPRTGFRQIAQYAEGALVLFFTFLFLYSIYTSSTTGISTLDTVPYKFFWS